MKYQRFDYPECYQTDHVQVLDIETLAPANENGSFPPWPLHEPVCASVLTQKKVGDDYAFDIETVDFANERAGLLRLFELLDPGATLVSWNGRAFDVPVLQLAAARQGLFEDTNQPEEDIVGAFFALCSAFQDARIVSWGGEAKDFLCLKRAAIERGMVLPPQLRDPAPFARTRLDLSSAVRSLGHYVHLPEFCEAIDVASKPMPSKDISLAVRHGAWDHVETQVVADVCTIAQVAWRYFLATGATSGTRETGDDAVLAALVERFPYDAWLERLTGSLQQAA